MNRGPRPHRRLLEALVFATSVAVACGSAAPAVAQTPAGTVIENQAMLSYEDVGGATVDDLSGFATVVVAPFDPSDEPDSPDEEIDDPIVVLEPAYVIGKTSVPACAVPVDPAAAIAYKIDVRNEGGLPRLFSTVSLEDGSVLEGVLIVDPLPPNTRLVPGSVTDMPDDAVAVLHPVGLELDAWIRAESWDGVTPVDRVGLLLLPSIAGEGAVASFSFEVTLAPGIQNGTAIFNSAGIDADADGAFEFVSPQVCNYVDAPGELPDPEINFLQPSDLVFLGDRFPEINVDEDWVGSEFYQLNPNDLLMQGVWLQLDATSLNLSGVDFDFTVGGTATGLPGAQSTTGARLLQVTLESEGTGDALLVTLRETGPNTGDFRSVYPVYLTERPVPGVTDADVACPAGASMDRLIEYGPETDVKDAIVQNCALHAIREDSLRVIFDVPVYGPNGVVARLQAVEDVAAVDPAGTVFDSFTGEPVSGATVVLLQSLLPLADTGFASCAELPLDQYERARDPFTGDVQPVEITDATNDDNDPDIGDYAYPFATPFHCYRLDVLPPPGYRFPSEVAPVDLLQFSDIVTDPSYGAAGAPDGAPGRGFPGAFLLRLENLFFDIPLDSDRQTLPSNPLRLQKTVDRDAAGIADVVVYTVEISNPLDQSVSALRIEDRMPFGFRFVEGTARVVTPDGDRAITPGGLPGPTLTFDLDGLSLAPGTSATLSYALRLSAGAGDGDGVNSAQAFGETEFRTPIASNVDRVRVDVEDAGVLSSRAIVFGKVYVDADCNDVQNDGEWPIGGVRLVMENGTFVITDENGQYSMFDVEPGNHVMRIDPATLPEGVRLKLIDTRQAASADSRFLDLRPGEMHRADFAAQCPGAGAANLQAAIEARNASIDGSWLLDEAERFDPRRAAAAPRQVIDSDGAISGNRFGGGTGPAADRRAGDASGTRVAGGDSDRLDVEEDGGDRSEVHAAAAMPLAEDVVLTVTEEQGRAGTWLWPTSERAADGRFMVAVRGGVTPTLYVNGAAVPASQLGEQLLNRDARTQVLAYYGVELAPGANALEVRATDAFGNERVMASGTFVRPGTAARLELLAESETLSADGGRSFLAVTVRMLDLDGNVARGTDFVTLETTEGSWLEEDLQVTTPGHQVRVEGGEAVVHLRSGTATGRATLRATNGTVEDELHVSLVAPMRPLFVAGIASVDTRFGGDIDDDGRAPDGDLDVGDRQTDERIALFMQGRVRGDAHLTLSYDSEKRSNDADLLRDIRPDGGFYPIPGDAAVRGFEARSRSPLYAKLEKARHSLLWGDYVTDTGSDASDLARVQKTLTGANAVFDDGSTRVQIFGAEADETRVSAEFRGNGTALGYTLDGDVVRHSEVVELRVRDRNNPGLVLETQQLARFEDYTIDYLTGRIRFLESIPSLDDALNPVSVFVTYDVEGKGEEYEVVGGRIEQRLGEDLTVSLAHTFDGHDRDGSELSGANLAYEGERTRIAASIATMENRDDDTRGEGYRMELEHRWSNGAASRATFGRGEAGFRNAAGGVSENRQEIRFEHTQALLERMDLRLAGTRSERLDTDDAQTAVEVAVVTEIAGVRVSSGLRAIEQETENGDDTFGTAQVGVHHSSLLAGAPIDVGAQYELALDGSDRRRAALDMEWALRENVAAYGTYELIDSLQGPAAFSDDSERSNLVVGMRANLMKDTETFSEYRLRGAADGRGEVAAQGVRGTYELMEGLAIQPSIERVDTISGPEQGDGFAVSFGVVDSRSEHVRRRLRLETRLGEEKDFHGVSGSWVARLDTDWSVSVREELRMDVIEGARDAVNQILTVGLARRPRRDNDHHLLLLYQWEEDRASNGVDRSIHLFSTHQNLELDAATLISGRVGFKFAETEVNGVNVETDALIVDGRLIHELTDRLDLDLHAGILATEGLDELRYAFGVGAGYLVRRDLRVTAGYNLVGFEDEDFDDEGFLARGFYAGLQFKFDEDSFRWLEGARP